MRGVLNLASTTGVAFLGLATQAYGQPNSPNLRRERYEAGDSSPAPAWAPYAALGFVAAICVAAGVCWLAQRTGCLNRLFPLRDQGDIGSDRGAAAGSDAERPLLDSPRSVS